MAAKPRSKSTRSNRHPASHAEVKPLLPRPLPDGVAGGEDPAERIRRRAYEIYQARRGGPGDPESDWMQAEREIAEEAVPSSRGSAPAAAEMHNRIPTE